MLIMQRVLSDMTVVSNYAYNVVDQRGTNTTGNLRADNKS